MESQAPPIHPRRIRLPTNLTHTPANTNLNISIALITAVVSLSSFLKDQRIIFLIPTTMFVGSMIILFQGAGINALGTYCFLLSMKIKSRLGHSEVMFDWEQGNVWKIGGHPFGLVACGMYFVSIPLLIIFMGISWAAFKWQPISLVIHTLELAIFIIYGVIMWRLNALNSRQKIYEMYKEHQTGSNSTCM